MKRIATAFTLALVLLLSPLVSIAAPDYDGIISELDYSEMLELKTRLDLAICASDEWKEVKVPPGLYEIGKDIPAGRWNMRVGEKDYAMVTFATELDETGSAYNDSMTSFVYLAGTDSFMAESNSSDSASYDLKAGTYLQTSATLFFTPGTGTTFNFGDTSETSSDTSKLQSELDAANARIVELEALLTAGESTEAVTENHDTIPTDAPTVAPTSEPDRDAVIIATAGDKNDNVKEIQNRLIDLGYMSDGADGQYGKKTAAAVKQFQEWNSIDSNGIVNGTTYDIMMSNMAIRRTATLDITCADFVKAFNLNLKAFENGARVDSIDESQYSSSVDIDKYSSMVITQRAGIVENITLIGSGDGSQESGLSILNVFCSAIAASNRDISLSDTGDMIFDLFDGKELEVAGISYSFSQSEYFGNMLTIMAVS